MAGLPWIRAYTSIRTDPRSLVLGRLLGDSHAYARILDLRLWLADNSPSGIISGQHAAIVVEEAVGWRGPPGAFAQAAIDAGFLRNVPARDSEGSGIEDADWVDEQSAHIAKVVRDNNKPDGRKKSRTNPVRLHTESRAAPLRDSSGENRELRVESREEASFPPTPVVGERQPAFVLTPAEPDKPPEPRRARAVAAKTAREPTGDSRHAVLVKLLVEADAEVTGKPYGFRGGRDAKAVTECLALADQDPVTAGELAGAEVLRRWRIGRRWVGFPACGSLSDLATHWNAFVRPQASAGVARGRTDTMPSNFNDVPEGGEDL